MDNRAIFTSAYRQAKSCFFLFSLFCHLAVKENLKTRYTPLSQALTFMTPSSPQATTNHAFTKSKMRLSKKFRLISMKFSSSMFRIIILANFYTHKHNSPRGKMFSEKRHKSGIDVLKISLNDFGTQFLMIKTLN